MVEYSNMYIKERRELMAKPLEERKYVALLKLVGWNLEKGVGDGHQKRNQRALRNST